MKPVSKPSLSWTLSSVALLPILAGVVALGVMPLACASGEMVGNTGSSTGNGTGQGGSTSTGNGSTGSGGSSFTGAAGSGTSTGAGGSTFTGAGGSGTSTGAAGTGVSTGAGGQTGFMMNCTPAAATISDMESGLFYYGTGSCPNGSWYLATAGGGTSTPIMGSITPVAPSPANTGDAASTKAIHVSGSGQVNTSATSYDAYVSLSASLNQPSQTEAGSVNASAYQGIKFWGIISGTVRLQVSSTATDQDAVPRTCVSCSDHLGAMLNPSTTWTQYQIPFSSLTQEGFGSPMVTTLDKTAVMKVLWKVIIPAFPTVTPAWDIWIDDLSFY